jgi:hypothetical protein
MRATDPMASSLTEAEAHALNYRLAGCTVPLIEEDSGGDQVAVRGTGTLFKVLGRHFLVTASHVLEDFSGNHIGLPVKRIGGAGEFWTFDKSMLIRSTNEYIDVGAIELHTAGLVEALLDQGQHFLSPDDLAPHRQQFDYYVIVGFPASVAFTRTGAIWPRAIKITSCEYLGDSNPRADPETDLLLEFAPDGERPDGTLAETPKLQGISGAAVWGLSAVASGPIWSPHNLLRVAGVQHSYQRDAYIRAHRWVVVAGLLERLDPTLGSACMERLGSVALARD